MPSPDEPAPTVSVNLVGLRLRISHTPHRSREKFVPAEDDNSFGVVCVCNKSNVVRSPLISMFINWLSSNLS